MDKAVKEQFEVFCWKEIKPDDWLWCNRCHRCYKASEFRKSKTERGIFLLCHYKDCHGDLPLDSIPWNKLTESNPELPKMPQRRKVYDLSPNSRQGEGISDNSCSEVLVFTPMG